MSTRTKVYSQNIKHRNDIIEKVSSKKGNRTNPESASQTTAKIIRPPRHIKV